MTQQPESVQSIKTQRKYKSHDKLFIERKGSLRHLSTQVLFISSLDDLILPKVEPTESEGLQLERTANLAAHKIVLKQLNAKFGTISDELDQHIRAIDNEDVLGDLAAQIMFIESPDDLIFPKILQ